MIENAATEITALGILATFLAAVCLIAREYLRRAADRDEKRDQFLTQFITDQQAGNGRLVASFEALVERDISSREQVADTLRVLCKQMESHEVAEAKRHSRAKAAAQPG